MASIVKIAKKQCACRECGEGYQRGAAAEKEFCSTPCRQSFNNRRMQRGAQLYDLFMALRFNRPLANTLNAWSLLCRLASEWRSHDQVEREGRESWQDPRRLIEKNPWLLRK